jgi:tetratricopeptide (TPR) repeat protein
LIYLQQNKNQEALADADNLIKRSASFPAELSNAYSMRGTAYMRLNQPQQAIDDFNACLAINPRDDNALVNRGVTLYSSFRQYDKALIDFSKGIELNPKGEYYINRSSCYYMMGEIEKAKADARTAIQKGVAVPEHYKSLLNL